MLFRSRVTLGVVHVRVLVHDERRPQAHRGEVDAAHDLAVEPLGVDDEHAHARRGDVRVGEQLADAARLPTRRTVHKCPTRRVVAEWSCPGTASSGWVLPSVALRDDRGTDYGIDRRGEGLRDYERWYWEG